MPFDVVTAVFSSPIIDLHFLNSAYRGAIVLEAKKQFQEYKPQTTKNPARFRSVLKVIVFSPLSISAQY